MGDQTTSSAGLRTNGMHDARRPAGPVREAMVEELGLVVQKTARRAAMPGFPAPLPNTGLVDSVHESALASPDEN